MNPTRHLAFTLLRGVLERHRTLEDMLDALPEAEGRDRAAAHRLAAAVLRRQGTLDAVLEPFLSRAPPPPVRLILLLGAAQLLLLETPPHAAVATSVDLARADGFKPFAALVNAVLRKVAVQGPSALTTLDGPRLDTPPWLWASWGNQARAIAEAHQLEAPLDLTLKPGAPAPQGGMLLPTGSIRFPAGTRVTALPGFDSGDFWVQDAAAALPALLLNAQPGEQVADLCAAPGGKTAQLAATGATVTAVERDPARLARLAENLARLGLAANLQHADAATWSPGALFDAILLDAPCSATGTIRRHPDVPALKRPRDVTVMAESQRDLLAHAATLLQPGGRLIYAVCSLQMEEGELHTPPPGLVPHPFAPEELPGLPEAITPTGTLRTHPALWPTRGGMDGFFAARFVRKP